ncbi:fibropellin-1-like [Ruditapes philippinarum]|uniref:fibropellin-1-like n=1 Tax=Ruditapes philippinarum TaxID=129788 RepID=UPI00295B6BCB|nr:fibropellin-1-like [Ruditapes philippinarum]
MGRKILCSKTVCASKTSVHPARATVHTVSNCTDGASDYICHCKPGYTGKNCLTEINECSSYPCQYGSTCVDLINGYRCLCPDGYTGENCDIEVLCFRGIVPISCDESYYNCTEDWHFHSPCNNKSVPAGDVRFPHPLSHDKFLMCDLMGRTYIVYCPPNQVYF